MDPERIKLLGFGLPLNLYVDSFRCAIMDWQGQTLTVRELDMIKLMNQITDKPSWDRKVFDDTVTEKWRQEARDAEDLDITEAMLDWVSQVYLINPKISSHGENHSVVFLLLTPESEAQ